MTFIFEMIVRSSLVVACGLCALWLLRRQPAALRHWIVAGTLALAAAQPALHSAMPSWQMPAMPASPQEVDGPVFTVGTEVDQLVVAASPDVASVDWLNVMMIVWLIGASVGLGVMTLGIGWLVWLG